jgi:hypothetical protein
MSLGVHNRNTVVLRVSPRKYEGKMNVNLYDNRQNYVRSNSHRLAVRWCSLSSQGDEHSEAKNVVVVPCRGRFCRDDFLRVIRLFNLEASRHETEEALRGD